MDDNVPFTQTARSWHYDRLIELYDDAGARDCTGLFANFTADGCRIFWTDAPDQAYWITFVFFSGSDMNAVLLEINEPATQLNVPRPYNGPFRPDCAIALGVTVPAALRNTVQANASMNVGFASRDGAQGSETLIARNGITTDTGGQIFRNDRFLPQPLFAAQSSADELTAWGDMSVELTLRDLAVAIEYTAVFLGFSCEDRATVLNRTAPALNGSTTETIAAPFEPFAAIIFATRLSATNAFDTGVGSGCLSIGAWSALSSAQASHGCARRPGNATTNTNSGFRADAAISTSNLGGFFGSARPRGAISNVTETSFDIDWTSLDNNEFNYSILLIGWPQQCFDAESFVEVDGTSSDLTRVRCLEASATISVDPVNSPLCRARCVTSDQPVSIDAGPQSMCRVRCVGVNEQVSIETVDATLQVLGLIRLEASAVIDVEPVGSDLTRVRCIEGVADVSVELSDAPVCRTRCVEVTDGIFEVFRIIADISVTELVQLTTSSQFVDIIPIGEPLERLRCISVDAPVSVDSAGSSLCRIRCVETASAMEIVRVDAELITQVVVEFETSAVLDVSIFATPLQRSRCIDSAADVDVDGTAAICRTRCVESSSFAEIDSTLADLQVDTVIQMEASAVVSVETADADLFRTRCITSSATAEVDGFAVLCRTRCLVSGSNSTMDVDVISAPLELTKAELLVVQEMLDIQGDFPVGLIRCLSTEQVSNRVLVADSVSPLQNFRCIRTSSDLEVVATSELCRVRCFEATGTLTLERIDAELDTTKRVEFEALAQLGIEPISAPVSALKCIASSDSVEVDGSATICRTRCVASSTTVEVDTVVASLQVEALVFFTTTATLEIDPTVTTVCRTRCIDSDATLDVEPTDATICRTRCVESAEVVAIDRIDAELITTKLVLFESAASIDITADTPFCRIRCMESSSTLLEVVETDSTICRTRCVQVDSTLEVVRIDAELITTATVEFETSAPVSLVSSSAPVCRTRCIASDEPVALVTTEARMCRSRCVEAQSSVDIVTVVASLQVDELVFFTTNAVLAIAPTATAICRTRCVAAADSVDVVGSEAAICRTRCLDSAPPISINTVDAELVTTKTVLFEADSVVSIDPVDGTICRTRCVDSSTSVDVLAGSSAGDLDLCRIRCVDASVDFQVVTVTAPLETVRLVLLESSTPLEIASIEAVLCRTRCLVVDDVASVDAVDATICRARCLVVSESLDVVRIDADLTTTAVVFFEASTPIEIAQSDASLLRTRCVAVADPVSIETQEARICRTRCVESSAPVVVDTVIASLQVEEMVFFTTSAIISTPATEARICRTRCVEVDDSVEVDPDGSIGTALCRTRCFDVGGSLVVEPIDADLISTRTVDFEALASIDLVSSAAPVCVFRCIASDAPVSIEAIDAAICRTRCFDAFQIAQVIRNDAELLVVTDTALVTSDIIEIDGDGVVCRTRCVRNDGIVVGTAAPPGFLDRISAERVDATVCRLRGFRTSAEMSVVTSNAELTVETIVQLEASASIEVDQSAAGGELCRLRCMEVNTVSGGFLEIVETLAMLIIDGGLNAYELVEIDSSGVAGGVRLCRVLCLRTDSASGSSFEVFGSEGSAGSSDQTLCVTKSLEASATLQVVQVSAELDVTNLVALEASVSIEIETGVGGATLPLCRTRCLDVQVAGAPPALSLESVSAEICLIVNLETGDIGTSVPSVDVVAGIGGTGSIDMCVLMCFETAPGLDAHLDIDTVLANLTNEGDVFLEVSDSIELVVRLASIDQDRDCSVKEGVDTELDTLFYQVAFQLIQDFGRDVEVIEPGVKTYNPATTETTTSGETRYTTRVSPVLRTNDKYRDGDLIQRGDGVVYVARQGIQFIPRRNLKIEHDGITWTVMDVQPIWSGDEIACWRLILGGGRTPRADPVESTRLDALFRPLSKTLIDRFGKVITLKFRADPKDYLVDLTCATHGGWCELCIKGILTEHKEDHRRENFIERERLRVYIAGREIPTHSPLKSDVIIVNGREWEILDVRAIYSGTAVAVWRLEIAH